MRKRAFPPPTSVAVGNFEKKKREGGRSELEKRWRTGETRGCEIRGSGNFRIVSLADLVPHVSSGAFKLLRRGLAISISTVKFYPIESAISASKSRSDANSVHFGHACKQETQKHYENAEKGLGPTIPM